MALSIADEYYLIALENYDYDWKEVVENLNYALSYEPDHAPGNCLMGRIFMDKFEDFTSAETYLTHSMSCRPDRLETCYTLLNLMTRMERFSEAFKLIAYIRTLPGCNESYLFKVESNMYEKTGELEIAIDKILSALATCINSSRINSFKDDLERLKEKQRNATRARYHLV